MVCKKSFRLNVAAWLLLAQVAGFAARCEAGLCPAVEAPLEVGARPPLRPLAQGFKGQARTAGIARLVKRRLPAGQSPASHRAAKPWPLTASHWAAKPWPLTASHRAAKPLPLTHPNFILMVCKKSFRLNVAAWLLLAQVAGFAARCEAGLCPAVEAR